CRGLGWVLRGDPFDAAGDLLSPVAYGHTGFTGTSLYIDPELELACVLLTNRVHYGRDRSVVGLRAKFHNTVAAAIADA
ncbi:serine hydrolase, partial [Paenibacillus barengoltzii]